MLTKATFIWSTIEKNFDFVKYYYNKYVVFYFNM